jgi:hypothetical protein
MDAFERQCLLDSAAERKRRLARIAVQSAIRKGQVIRQPCEECGEKKTEAHHDDYDKPLDVRWLCFVCHRKWHKERWHKDRGKEPKKKATA